MESSTLGLMCTIARVGWWYLVEEIVSPITSCGDTIKEQYIVHVIKAHAEALIIALDLDLSAPKDPQIR